MMVNKKLVKITKDLILAEKKIKKIGDVPKVKQTIETKQTKPLQFSQPPQRRPSPMPMPQMQMLDLGKLNQFTQDREVVAIEAESGKNVKIRKQQLVETNVQLSSQEISDILSKFATILGIPLTPVFKATVGILTLNAFITPATTKILITKRLA